jgi:hypothetical protein
VSSSDHVSPPLAFTIAMLCWRIRGTRARRHASTQIGVPSRRSRSFAAQSPRPLGPGNEVARFTATSQPASAAASEAPSKMSAVWISAPHARATPAASGRRTSARTRWPCATRRGIMWRA